MNIQRLTLHILVCPTLDEHVDMKTIVVGEELLKHSITMTEDSIPKEDSHHERGVETAISAWKDWKSTYDTDSIHSKAQLKEYATASLNCFDSEPFQWKISNAVVPTTSTKAGAEAVDEILKMRLLYMKQSMVEWEKVVLAPDLQDADAHVMKRYAELLDECIETGLNGAGNKTWRVFFDLLDTDQDGYLSKAQSQTLLETLVQLQQSFVTEFISNHMNHITKVHEKQLKKVLREQDWILKTREKIRCVLHFAHPDPHEDASAGEGKEEEHKPKTFPADSIKLFNKQILCDSLGKEFPECAELSMTYFKAFQNERYTFYLNRREKWKNRVLGVLFIGGVYALDAVLITI